MSVLCVGAVCDSDLSYRVRLSQQRESYPGVSGCFEDVLQDCTDRGLCASGSVVGGDIRLALRTGDGYHIAVPSALIRLQQESTYTCDCTIDDLLFFRGAERRQAAVVFIPFASDRAACHVGFLSKSPLKQTPLCQSHFFVCCLWSTQGRAGQGRAGRCAKRPRNAARRCLPLLCKVSVFPYTSFVCLFLSFCVGTAGDAGHGGHNGVPHQPLGAAVCTWLQPGTGVRGTFAQVAVRLFIVKLVDWIMTMYCLELVSALSVRGVENRKMKRNVYVRCE